MIKWNEAAWSVGRYVVALILALSISFSILAIYEYIHGINSIDPFWDDWSGILLPAVLQFSIVYVMLLLGGTMRYWFAAFFAAPFTLFFVFTGYYGLTYVHLPFLLLLIFVAPLILGFLLGYLTRPLFYGPWSMWFRSSFALLGLLVLVGGAYAGTHHSPSNIQTIVPHGIQINASQ